MLKVFEYSIVFACCSCFLALIVGRFLSIGTQADELEAKLVKGNK